MYAPVQTGVMHPTPVATQHTRLTLFGPQTAALIGAAFLAQPTVTDFHPNLVLVCDQSGWTGTFTVGLTKTLTDALGDGPVEAIFLVDSSDHGERGQATIIRGSIRDLIDGKTVLFDDGITLSLNDETILAAAI